MRLLVATVAAMALLATAASAQNPNQQPWMQLPTKVEKGDLPSDDGQATKANDKAYRSALDAIPQAKGNDPWSSVREAPKPKRAH